MFQHLNLGPNVMGGGWTWALIFGFTCRLPREMVHLVCSSCGVGVCLGFPAFVRRDLPRVGAVNTGHHLYSLCPRKAAGAGWWSLPVQQKASGQLDWLYFRFIINLARTNWLDNDSLHFRRHLVGIYNKPTSVCWAGAIALERWIHYY